MSFFKHTLTYIANNNSRWIELVRFGLVGVSSTALNYMIYLLLLPVVNAYIAFSIGYGLSFIANFYLSVYFTFKTNASVKKGIGFGVSQGINYLTQLGLLSLMIWLGIPKQYAPIPVIVIVVPISFLLVRTVLKSKRL